MVAFAKVAAFEVDDLAFFGDLAGEGCRDDTRVSSFDGRRRD